MHFNIEKITAHTNHCGNSADEVKASILRVSCVFKTQMCFHPGCDKRYFSSSDLANHARTYEISLGVVTSVSTLQKIRVTEKSSACSFTDCTIYVCQVWQRICVSYTVVTTHLTG